MPTGLFLVGEGGTDYKRHEKTFGVMELVIFFIVVMASQEYICLKIYQVVHLKYVQFIIYQLQLNKMEKIKK